MDGVVERDARPPIVFTFLLFYFSTFKQLFYPFTLLLLKVLFTFLPFYFSNLKSPFYSFTFKQGFFALQTRLVYDVNKPCL